MFIMLLLNLQELIHVIVGEVVASGTIKRGNKGAAKGAPLAHLMNFLIRACTVLPDNILLFSKVYLGIGPLMFIFYVIL